MWSRTCPFSKNRISGLICSAEKKGYVRFHMEGATLLAWDDDLILRTSYAWINHTVFFLLNLILEDWTHLTSVLPALLIAPLGWGKGQNATIFVVAFSRGVREEGGSWCRKWGWFWALISICPFLKMEFTRFRPLLGHKNESICGFENLEWLSTCMEKLDLSGTGDNPMNVPGYFHHGRLDMGLLSLFFFQTG